MIMMAMMKSMVIDYLHDDVKHDVQDDAGNFHVGVHDYVYNEKLLMITMMMIMM